MEGIETRVPDIGKSWEDSKIREGCQLALFFKQQDVYSWLSLEKIQVKKTDSLSAPAEFYLKTKHQTLIRWGNSVLSSQIYCDPETQLHILKQFCQSYPDLKGISLADVRFEEDSFVCFP
ncbi:MAG: hypothetical protein AABZ60_21805 [Planctomycetota bacterium]